MNHETRDYVFLVLGMLLGLVIHPFLVLLSILGIAIVIGIKELRNSSDDDENTLRPV